MQRETLEDGSLRLTSEACEFRIRRLRPGALLVVGTGYDDGSLSDATLEALSDELVRNGSLSVFIDGGGTEGVTTWVRETWTRWMQTNRDRTRITLLVASKFMSVTVNVAKHLAGFGQMVVLSDRARFDAAVEAAATR